MLQNFGKYASNLPTPSYFVPNNLKIYLGWRLDPPTYVGTNSQILPFLFFEGIPYLVKQNILLRLIKKKSPKCEDGGHLIHQICKAEQSQVGI